MELDAEARDILALAREARTPSAADKARIERRLALAVGLTAAGAVSTSTAPAAASTSIAGTAAGTAAALKWTLGGCALLAAAVASYAVLSSPAKTTPQAPAHVNAPTAVPAAEPTRVPAVAVPARATTPQAAPSSAGPTELPGIAPGGSASSMRAARHTQPHARAAHTGAQDALRDELELLHAAQAAWRAGDPAHALALANEHRRRHPHSALALERDALRVLAFCDVGNTRAAVQLARTWLARAPSSPLRASIEASCAAK